MESKKKKFEPSFEEAYFTGLECYYLGELDAAINHFENAVVASENDNRANEMLTKANNLRDDKEMGNEEN